MRKSPSDPLFLMSEAATHRPRFLLTATMLVLLVFVFFAAFRVLDLGEGTLSNRRARKMLGEAASMEEGSLYRSAADIYARVSEDPALNPELRVRAATRLADLYTTQLHDPEAATTAMERAYYYSPQGPQREALRRRLENLTGRAPSSAAGRRSAGPQTPIARLGERTVTLEEVLYAWGQFNGERDPTNAELEPFVHMYLNLVLLGEEAGRRGLDQRPAIQFDLALKRLLGLNQALTRQIIEDLAPPTSATLAAYYEQNVAAFSQPRRVLAGEIVTNDPTAERAVAEGIKAGEDFAGLARRYSLDAGVLPRGYIVGEVSENDGQVRAIGPVPGLMEWLMRAEDGATTGPLRTARGQVWVQVVGHEEAATPPLEAIRDDVLLAYQRRQIEIDRAGLIERLRAERPVEIMRPSGSGARTSDAATTGGAGGLKDE
jgi:hypothetical protein